MNDENNTGQGTAPASGQNPGTDRVPDAHEVLAQLASQKNSQDSPSETLASTQPTQPVANPVAQPGSEVAAQTPSQTRPEQVAIQPEATAGYQSNEAQGAQPEQTYPAPSNYSPVPIEPATPVVEPAVTGGDLNKKGFFSNKKLFIILAGSIALIGILLFVVKPSFLFETVETQEIGEIKPVEEGSNTIEQQASIEQSGNDSSGGGDEAQSSGGSQDSGDGSGAPADQGQSGTDQGSSGGSGNTTRKHCKTNGAIPDGVCKAILSVVDDQSASNPLISTDIAAQLSLFPDITKITIEEDSWKQNGNSGTVRVIANDIQPAEVTMKKKNGTWIAQSLTL